MAFDSTAGLLFTIGADSEAATENIARFRQLLGKDLDTMKEEFHDFSHEVLGSLQTVSGAVTAGAAVIGAAVVASAAFALEAANKFVEYAEQVEKGSLRTGIAAEDMSGLMFAAKSMGVGYEALIGGLTKFSSYIVKSAEDTNYAKSAFAKLGISQEDVKAGIEHELPLLMKAQDAIHGLGSQVERVAIVRELMSRGGPALVQVLQLDAVQMKALTDRARELGLVLSEEDTKAAKEFKIVLADVKASWEAMSVSIGRVVLPALRAFEIGVTALMDTFRSGYSDMTTFFTAYLVNVDKAIERTALIAKNKEGDKKLLPGADDVKKAMADFTGLSNVIEALRMKTAGAGNELVKAVAEIQHMQLEAAKAQENFERLKASGTLSAETIKREAAALAALPAGINALTLALQKKINENILLAGDELDIEMNAQREKSLAEELAAWDLHIAKRKEQMQKAGTDTLVNLAKLDADHKAGTKKRLDDHAAAVLAAGEDLRGKINAQREHGWQEQLAAFDIEIAKLKEQYTKKGELTLWIQGLLFQYETAGHNRLLKANDDAWGQEMVKLQSSLATMLSARLSGAERIKFIYDGDVAKFSAVEEEKVVIATQGEVKKAGIRALFAMNREALLKKEENDLQALKNSQGWQGVFGGEFARLLKGDEAAAREWAESLNQSALMVKFSLTALKQEAEDAFSGFSKGMSGNIAQAIVYSGSIKQAMQTAAASALESLAAESIGQALFATALGFLRLAQYDGAGAASAFEAAELFGSIGLASAVAGRAIAPPSASAGAGAGSTAAAGAGPSSNQSVLPTNSAAASTDRSRVTVNVYGHVFGFSGVEELAGALNDAVSQRDVRLIATQVKQATRATV
jgi:hypothetical protein